MKCRLYSNSTLIGLAEFTGFDDGMNCAVGDFFPEAAYDDVRPVVQQLTRASLSPGDADSSWDGLSLTLMDAEGRSLNPAGGTVLFDYSEQFEEPAYEVHVLGLPQEEFVRLMPGITP